MKPGEIVKRTKRTAEAVGMLLAGLVVIWFFLAVGGVFEDTWFDLPGDGGQEEEQIMENDDGTREDSSR